MKNKNIEILENITTAINRIIFWREFTFNQNKFQLPKGSNVELADNVVWLDDTLFLFQIKQRDLSIKNILGNNENWFKDVVLKKGSKQIKDTLSFLEIYGDKQITNLCGLPFRIDNIKGSNLHKIILYGINPMLSDNFKNQKYKLNKDGIFIHLFCFQDYLTVCKTLITPAEMNIYLIFRKNVLVNFPEKSFEVSEKALIGQFLSDEHITKPSENYISFFDNFYNDTEDFDFSHIFDNFKDQHVKIYGEDNEREYYKIMIQFAKLRRAELKNLMPKLNRIVEEAKNGSKQVIENLMALDTDCAFFMGSLPQFDNNKKQIANNALNNLTSLVKYHFKAEKCIGVFALGDKSNKSISLLWCYIDEPWRYDLDMEKIVNEKYPFKSQMEYSNVKSYRFKNGIN